MPNTAIYKRKRARARIIESRFVRAFVGEPNQNWQIESYNASRLGVIEITEKGYYNVNLNIEPKKGEVVKFQCVWLGVE